MRVCVCACVRVCVRVFVHTCVSACIPRFNFDTFYAGINRLVCLTLSVC